MRHLPVAVKSFSLMANFATSPLQPRTIGRQLGVANVVVPSKLSKRQRELLQEFAKESGDTIAEHQGLREKLGLG